MGLYSDEADWVAGQLFANVAMYFVAFLTLNTDTDIVVSVETIVVLGS